MKKYLFFIFLTQAVTVIAGNISATETACVAEAIDSTHNCSVTEAMFSSLKRKFLENSDITAQHYYEKKQGIFNESAQIIGSKLLEEWLDLCMKHKDDVNHIGSCLYLHNKRYLVIHQQRSIHGFSPEDGLGTIAYDLKPLQVTSITFDMPPRESKNNPLSIAHRALLPIIYSYATENRSIIFETSSYGSFKIDQNSFKRNKNSFKLDTNLLLIPISLHKAIAANTLYDAIG